MPSFIKDTRYVINLLLKFKPQKGMWLVTADVSSLYTIIAHDQGLSAVNYYLEPDSRLPNGQISFIIILEFAATHNYFWCNDQFFQEDRGVAMGGGGTICP